MLSTYTDNQRFRLSSANLKTRNYFLVFLNECWMAAPLFFTCRRLHSLEVWRRCRQPVSRWEGTTLFWMKMCCCPCRSFRTPTTMACMPNSSTTTAPISWHLALWEASLSTSLSLTRRKWEEKVRKYSLFTTCCSKPGISNLVTVGWVQSTGIIHLALSGPHSHHLPGPWEGGRSSAPLCWAGWYVPSHDRRILITSPKMHRGDGVGVIHTHCWPQSRG